MAPIGDRLARGVSRALAAASVVALAGHGCGSDAVGIEVCRTIENARCEAAQACASAGFTPPDVVACQEFYRDQCLHGIENSDVSPSSSQGEQCAAAVAAVAGCKRSGAATMADCNVPLAAGADPATPPCTILLESTHLLQACAFVAKAETSTTTTGAGGGGGTGGTGGGTTSSTTSSGTTTSSTSSTTSSSTTSSGSGGGAGGTGGAGGN